MASLRGLLVDWRPLRESRDFRHLWLGQLVSMVGVQIVVVAVPYQVYLLTHSSLAVGILGIFQAVPLVIAGLYGGTLADRFDRRRVLIVAKAVVAVGSLFFAAGAVGLRAPLLFVYVLAGLVAGLGTIEHSARTAMVARMMPGPRLPAALSLVQVLYQLAQVAGPSLAGLVIAGFGLVWAYGIDVGCFLVSFLLLWGLSPQPPLDGVRPTLGWRAPAEALAYVWRTPVLLGIFAIDLNAMVFGLPRALFPALATTVYRVGPAGLGLLYAAPGAGALIGSLFTGWVSRTRRQGLAIILAVAGWGAAMTVFGLTAPLFWLGLVMLGVAGACDMVSAIFRHTILQLSSPDSLRGRMSAFNSMVVTTGPRLGDLESGVVAQLTNTIFSVVSGGLLCLFGVGLVTLAIPALRRRESGYPTPSSSTAKTSVAPGGIGPTPRDP